MAVVRIPAVATEVVVVGFEITRADELLFHVRSAVGSYRAVPGESLRAGALAAFAQRVCRATEGRLLLSTPHAPAWNVVALVRGVSASWFPSAHTDTVSSAVAHRVACVLGKTPVSAECVSGECWKNDAHFCREHELTRCALRAVVTALLENVLRVVPAPPPAAVRAEDGVGFNAVRFLEHGRGVELHALPAERATERMCESFAYPAPFGSIYPELRHEPQLWRYLRRAELDTPSFALAFFSPPEQRLLGLRLGAAMVAATLLSTQNYDDAEDDDGNPRSPEELVQRCLPQFVHTCADNRGNSYVTHLENALLALWLLGVSTDALRRDLL
jgi:hypothetical protein